MECLGWRTHREDKWEKRVWVWREERRSGTTKEKEGGGDKSQHVLSRI
jgi:hypothetical protein